jgi:ribosome biogenesis GTPase / thiamine phosphate phosphatase
LNEQETRTRLNELGFDDWFAARRDGTLAGTHSLARVSAVDRGAYLIVNEAGELTAELAGKFRFNAESSVDLPCVGDWAYVQYHNGGTLAVIHGVLPRRTFLRRKAAGRDVDFQMIAANIDAAFIVQSCHYDFNLHRLDRYLVLAHEGHIEPVLVLTKTDLVTPQELEKTVTAIREAGISARILTLSNESGAGLDGFRQFLVPGRTYCLLGSSGVGKTTLINRLIGREALATRAISGTGEGTHTTSRRQLIVLEQGALMVDTPGMRELGMLGAGAALDDSFAEIRGLSRECRFADCRHVGEPGCAVRAAIERGELDADRYESYAKLKKEAEHHEMTFVEKRKKDRDFGKFIKTAKKQIRNKR